MSLALALAIPLTVSGGARFPHRAVVVFLTYAGVLLTLVPAGLTLGPLIDRLGLAEGPSRRRQLAEARASVLQAALEEIETLAGEERVAEQDAERLRALYEARLAAATARLRGDGGESGAAEGHARVRRSIMSAERRRLAELGAQRAYPAAVLREIGHQLDLEESRRR